MKTEEEPKCLKRMTKKELLKNWMEAFVQNLKYFFID
jgi:hypothetical protein